MVRRNSVNNDYNICVDVMGDFACFAQSDSKVEKITYDVITPSAARNILRSYEAYSLHRYQKK